MEANKGMTAAIQQAVAAQEAKDGEVDNAARVALVAPLPGPTAAAVNPCQDIQVGKWTVGPFRDRHYEWLGLLKHPIERIQTKELIANVTGKPVWVVDDLLWEKAKGQVAQTLAAKKTDKKGVDWDQFWIDVAEAYGKLGGKRAEPSVDDTYIPRGASLWQLAMLVTRKPSEVRTLLKQQNGLELFKDAAEAEFGDCTAQELLELYLAIDKQMKVYWSTTVSHEEVPVGKEGSAAADAPANPFST
jgi:hypothetical protein